MLRLKDRFASIRSTAVSLIISLRVCVAAANLNLKRQRGGRTRTKQTKSKVKSQVHYELIDGE
jgi:hypothetical protein